MKFKPWFIGQFGKAPNMTDERRKRLIAYVVRGQQAESELMADADLRSQWTAALYAWNVEKS